MIDETIYDEEFHKSIENSETPQAFRLGEWVIQKYRPQSIIDFGCSTGTYLKPWVDAGYPALGLEYSSDAINHKLVPQVMFCDLTKPIRLPKAEFGLCLEVAEHIEEEFSDQIISNLCNNVTRVIIFSAAHPGQGGIGHVNCQQKDYWVKKFNKNGWRLNIYSTDKLAEWIRGCYYYMTWLPENVMVLLPGRDMEPVT